MGQSSENPGTTARLPRPVSGGAGGEGAWDEKSMLNLLSQALRKECGLEASDLELGVRDQVVYLRGTVADLAQKREAASAALAVPGVRAIVNNLRIAPLTPRNDHHVAADVRAALARDSRLVRPPEVKVLDGVVYLSGTAGSLEARYAAEEAAWSVRGVQDMVSDITVTALCPRPDEDLLRDIQVTLSRCLGLESSKLQVEVRGGVARLQGHVRSQFEKFLAEDAVRWTPCIVDVVNELRISSWQTN